MVTRFCKGFSILSSTVGGGLCVWTRQSETTETLVPFSQSESDPSRSHALLVIFAFVGGFLKTDKDKRGQGQENVVEERGGQLEIRRKCRRWQQFIAGRNEDVKINGVMDLRRDGRRFENLSNEEIGPVQFSCRSPRNEAGEVVKGHSVRQERDRKDNKDDCREYPRLLNGFWAVCRKR